MILSRLLAGQTEEAREGTKEQSQTSWPVEHEEWAATAGCAGCIVYCRLFGINLSSWMADKV